VPTRLGQGLSPRALIQAREVAAKETVLRAVARGPWMGYVPDLPAHTVGFNGFQSCSGVVARSRGRGEVLTYDDGTALIAEADSPSGLSGVGSALTGAEDFRLLNGDIQPTWVWAGDDATALITMKRLTPALALVEIDPDAAVTTDPVGGREVLWDMAPFPAGAPTRNYAALTGIVSPSLVMCSYDEDGPRDPILITPADPTIATPEDFYSELWETSFPGALTIPAPLAYPFKCQSVEAFEGRLHFLNTVEGTVKFTNRLRWTAVATADASNQTVGSGRLDLWEFERPGLRVETIGNQLACYFGDGVAFITRTGSFVDPYRYQVVAKQRGLLATGALCAYSANVHFGIFDDGWWKLNFAGQWQPVGVVEVKESGEKEVLVHKWKDTFFSLLDIDKRHLITCTFDARWRRILIAFPVLGINSDDDMMVWSYDVDTDRVWPLGIQSVTQWAAVDKVIQAGVIIDNLDQPIDSYSNTINSWGARRGLRQIVSGDSIGFLHGWDPDLTTRNGNPVTAYWQTHSLNPTPDPDSIITAHKVGTEYQSFGDSGAGFSCTVVGEPSGSQQTRSWPTEGTGGSIQYGYGNYRLAGEHHTFNFSSTAPFAVRTLRAEWLAVGGLAQVANPEM
jgi:hypothetical protein